MYIYLRKGNLGEKGDPLMIRKGKWTVKIW